jgi:hypothetical protein
MDDDSQDPQDIQGQITELKERVDRIEGALRALAVVYAIPRISTPGEERRT